MQQPRTVPAGIDSKWFGIGIVWPWVSALLPGLPEGGPKKQKREKNSRRPDASLYMANDIRKVIVSQCKFEEFGSEGFRTPNWVPGKAGKAWYISAPFGRRAIVEGSMRFLLVGKR